MTDLIGIVCCGGLSSRMGRDKGLLNYHGKPQRYHLYEMLEVHCEKVFISCSKDQAPWVLPKYDTLVDDELYHGIGPMSAVLTAFDRFPHAAILVVGCDYPFLEEEHIAKLVENRIGLDDAVFYLNADTMIIEPLIAVYENSARAALLKCFEMKNYSLRRFLDDANTCAIVAHDPSFLKSVDDPMGYAGALQLLQSQAAETNAGREMKNEK